MATYYVRHLATGANNGTSWANAYTSLFITYNPGDIIYVASDHVGNAPVRLTGGTAQNPVQVIAAEPTANPPTSLPAPGVFATFNQTSDNQVIIGHYFFYGINFNVATSWFYFPSVENDANVVFENCKFRIAATCSWLDDFPTKGSQYRYHNCEFVMDTNAYNNVFTTGSRKLVMRGCKVSYGPASTTAKTPVFFSGRHRAPNIECSGCNFTASSANTFLYLTQLVGAEYGKITFSNCKTSSSPTFGVYPSSGITPIGSPRIRINNTLVQSTSSGRLSTPFSNGFHRGVTYMSADVNRVSTTPAASQSRLNSPSYSASTLVDGTGTPNRVYMYSFEDPVYLWNETVGTPVTLSFHFSCGIYVTTSSQWIEVSYPADPASPRSSVASNRNGVIWGSGAAEQFLGGNSISYPATTSTWTNPFTGEIRQLASVTFTPQAKGFLRIRFNSASYNYNQNTGLWFSPRPLIS